MAAISILFHNIFKYPRKHSARADLEILRAGQYHFERHVHPLRFNSRLKSLFQKMQTAAEELVSQSSSLHRGTNADRLRYVLAYKIAKTPQKKDSEGITAFQIRNDCRYTVIQGAQGCLCLNLCSHHDF
jgi:hypothetical protein